MLSFFVAPLALALVGQAAAVPGTRSFAPTITDEPLLNPGMGIYYMCGNAEQPDPQWWFMPMCGIAYHRCHWSDLEPERGVYRFDEYLGPMFDTWVARLGKRVAFRVMCESMHGRTQYVTPKWVFDLGVPGVKHIGLDGKEQIDPVFWDPLYLDLHCEFIRAFGKWADGRPGLEFVDIGSIGEWGEMHFGQHVPGRWTSQQFEETGFSEFKLAMAYRRVIDAFAEAFPHSRVFLNVGDRQVINDYAAMRGLHFRQDGLTPSGASYNVESKLYPQYAFRGVQCNLELHSGYEEMQARGWGIEETIEKGLSAPISYQNINFGWRALFGEPVEEVRSAVELCAQRIGYRFVLTEATIPETIHTRPTIPGRFFILQRWVNQGIAPCYESLAFEWALLSQDGQALARVQAFPATPTTQWRPGEEVQAGATIDLPAGAPAGEYTLAVRLFRPEEPATAYYLPLAGRDAAGWYRVGAVELVPEDGGAMPETRLDFEAPLAGVSTPEGVQAQIEGEPVHGGAGALHVSGSCANTWNYALIARAALVPGARYRIEGWMRVDRLDGLAQSPYFKVGINAADGAWITNESTEAYALAQPGTWQRLAVDFDVPPSGTTGDICIERGALEGTADVDLRVDDVVLRMLAGP